MNKYLLNEIERIDKERREALENQDPVRYYNAIISGGYIPEDEYLFERGKEIISSRNLENIIEKNKKNRFDYESFGRIVEKGDYNPSNIFDKIPDKRSLLYEYGLKYLKISPKKSIPISDAKPERVGKVFKERYETYLRRKQ